MIRNIVKGLTLIPLYPLTFSAHAKEASPTVSGAQANHPVNIKQYCEPYKYNQRNARMDPPVNNYTRANTSGRDRSHDRTPRYIRIVGTFTSHTARTLDQNVPFVSNSLHLEKYPVQENSRTKTIFSIKTISRANF